MTVQWYAARTKPMAEYTARDRLESLGIECLLPCIQTAYPRSGHADAPLFSGYLFLRLDLCDTRLLAQRLVPELAGLVAFEGVAASVLDETIDGLRGRVARLNSAGGLWAQFGPGERV